MVSILCWLCYFRYFGAGRTMEICLFSLFFADDMGLCFIGSDGMHFLTSGEHF
jgi:hypothetical protein